MKSINDIELIKHVEKEFGKPIQSTAELHQLKEDVYSVTKKSIGFNTLRRFFGFLPKTTANATTLNTLSNYIGFLNHTTFLKHTHINDAWFQWLRLQEMEVKDNLTKDDLRFLLQLKLHNKDYVLYFISLLKSLILRRNFNTLYFIFSVKELFLLSGNNIAKISNTIGLLFRSLTIKEIKKATKLAELKLFRETVLYFMIDYSSLYGYYGVFLHEAVKHEKKKEHQLFLKLMINYALFLNGKKTPLVLEKPMLRDVYPVLHGRYVAHQILTSTSVEQEEEIIKTCLASTINKEDIMLFYIEIIPALIIQQRVDLMALILDSNYEYLFNLQYWNNKDCENIYLIAEALVAIEKGNYLDAKNHLKFVDKERSVYDYREYVHVFYLIANYHIAKNTSKTTISSIEQEFKALIKKLGFHYFNLAFLKKYFDSTRTTGTTATLKRP